MKLDSPILPLALLAAALVVEIVTRTVALMDNRGELKAFYDSQEQQYRIALDLQKQLEGVAADTARLAEGGNRNAVAVIERLREAGITVNPNATSPNAKPSQSGDPKP